MMIGRFITIEAVCKELFGEKNEVRITKSGNEDGTLTDLIRKSSH